MELPDQTGVMALPNAVLFPGVLMPLYIFEPRYRRMLAASLAGERLFVVGLLRKGWDHAGAAPSPYPVGGIGLIRTCVGQPDGTSHLVLQGLSRVRLRQYVAADPDLGFPIARIEPLASREPGEVLRREPLLDAVHNLVKARARLGVEVPQEVLESLLAVENLDLFTDLVGYTLLDDSHEKQALLETLDIRERLAKLVALLQKQVAQFAVWTKLQGRLPNKDVGHN